MKEKKLEQNVAQNESSQPNCNKRLWNPPRVNKGAPQLWAAESVASYCSVGKLTADCLSCLVVTRKKRRMGIGQFDYQTLLVLDYIQTP